MTNTHNNHQSNYNSHLCVTLKSNKFIFHLKHSIIWTSEYTKLSLTVLLFIGTRNVRVIRPWE